MSLEESKGVIMDILEEDFERLNRYIIFDFGRDPKLSDLRVNPKKDIFIRFYFHNKTDYTNTIVENVINMWDPIKLNRDCPTLRRIGKLTGFKLNKCYRNLGSLDLLLSK